MPFGAAPPVKYPSFPRVREARRAAAVHFCIGPKTHSALWFAITFRDLETQGGGS